MGNLGDLLRIALMSAVMGNVILKVFGLVKIRWYQCFHRNYEKVAITPQ